MCSLLHWLLCWFQCTSKLEKRESPLSSSDANHNSVLPCSANMAAGDNRCTSGSASMRGCCENQAASGHSDLGYASDGDCESCSSQGLARSSGESENSHSSGCCSPSSTSVAATETGDSIQFIITSTEEGGYVFGAVCLSVCLSVHRITRKLVNRF